MALKVKKKMSSREILKLTNLKNLQVKLFKTAIPGKALLKQRFEQKCQLQGTGLVNLAERESSGSVCWNEGRSTLAKNCLILDKSPVITNALQVWMLYTT